MNTCQIVIGANVTFCQILDEILMEGPSSTLGRPKGLPVIKVKKLNHISE
jgi:hypothetical protein